MTDVLACLATRSTSYTTKPNKPKRSYKRSSIWPLFRVVKKDRNLGCGLRTKPSLTAIATAERSLKVIVIGRKPVDDWAQQLGFRHCSFVRFTYNPKFLSKQVYGADKVIAAGAAASDFLFQMAIPHFRLVNGRLDACKQWLGA